MAEFKFIRLIIVTSVWLFIALNAYQVVIHVTAASHILGAYPGGYTYKVFIAPFALIALELFLWFRMFRQSRHPARMFAGIVGAYIWLMVILVTVVVADLYGRDLSPPLLWLYAYAGAGHLGYAVFGKERGN